MNSTASAPVVGSAVVLLASPVLPLVLPPVPAAVLPPVSPSVSVSPVGLSQQVLAEVHKAAHDTSIAALKAVAERHCAGIEVQFEARPGVALRGAGGAAAGVREGGARGLRGLRRLRARLRADLLPGDRLTTLGVDFARSAGGDLTVMAPLTEGQDLTRTACPTCRTCTPATPRPASPGTATPPSLLLAHSRHHEAPPELLDFHRTERGSGGGRRNWLP